MWLQGRGCGSPPGNHRIERHRLYSADDAPAFCPLHGSTKVCGRVARARVDVVFAAQMYCVSVNVVYACGHVSAGKAWERFSEAMRPCGRKRKRQRRGSVIGKVSVANMPSSTGVANMPYSTVWCLRALSAASSLRPSSLSRPREISIRLCSCPRLLSFLAVVLSPSLPPSLSPVLSLSPPLSRPPPPSFFHSGAVQVDEDGGR
jgi:hypothetical protein